MERILIVKTSAIGDVIQASFVLSYLKARMPHVKIDWVVEKGLRHLMLAHPLVDEVITMDTKRWRKTLFTLSTWKEIWAFLLRLKQNRYDVLFDLQGNCKSSFVDFFSRANVKVGFGKKSVAERPNLLFTDVQIEVEKSLSIYERYQGLLKSYFNDSLPSAPRRFFLSLNDAERLRMQAILSSEIFTKQNVFLLCFGSNWENKRLSRRRLFEFVSMAIKERGANFIISYADNRERDLAEQLHLAHPEHTHPLGDMTLALWQSVMSRTRGVITMDSAALALCALGGIPSFSIFGPSSSYVYKPRGKMHVSVDGFCPYSVAFVGRCKYLRSCRTGACIKDITLSQLMVGYDHFCKVTSMPLQQDAEVKI